MVISQVTVYLAQASVLLSRKNTAVFFFSASLKKTFSWGQRAQTNPRNPTISKKVILFNIYLTFPEPKYLYK